MGIILLFFVSGCFAGGGNGKVKVLPRSVSQQLLPRDSKKDKSLDRLLTVTIPLCDDLVTVPGQISPYQRADNTGAMTQKKWSLRNLWRFLTRRNQLHAARSSEATGTLGQRFDATFAGHHEDAASSTASSSSKR